MRGPNVFLALIVACAALTGVCSAAHAAPPLPEGWAVHPTPAPRTCEWSRANYSKRKWRVRLADARLVIESAEEPPLRRTDTPAFAVPPETGAPPYAPCEDCVMRVADGWLVGYNYGEWGGRLWWTDLKGENAYPIADAGRCKDIPDTGPLFWNEKPGAPQPEGYVGNIVSVQQSGGRIFAFSGLAHLGVSVGSLSRIELQGGKYRACTVRNLEAAPEVVLPDGQGNWLALTSGGIAPGPERAGELLRVSAGGTIQHLARPPFLDFGVGVYPNSMVRLSEGTLYVGMRHFVARLLPDENYRTELLLQTGRPAFDFEPSIDAPRSKYAVVPYCERPK